MEIALSDITRGDRNGQCLYLIVTHTGDPKGYSELWRANDMAHLKSLYISDLTSEGDTSHDDHLVHQIEEDWNIEIIPVKIGFILNS